MRRISFAGQVSPCVSDAICGTLAGLFGGSCQETSFPLLQSTMQHKTSIRKQAHDVVLFLPNTRWYDQRPWMLIPHSALILSSILKPEFDFAIFDANAENLDEATSLAGLKNLAPRVFLSSGISVEYYRQCHLSFKLAKEVDRDCITVFGGVYPTLMGEEALEDKNIDYIFVGQAEGRAPAFINFLIKEDHESARKLSGVGYRDENGKVVINPVEKNTPGMEAVKPDYSLIDVKSYLPKHSREYLTNFMNEPTATVLTSYGCPYNCFFCAARTIRGRGILFRPAGDVLEEIEFLMKEFGIKHLSFMDECFLAERQRTEIILNAFIDRKYDLAWKMPNVSAWHLDDPLLEMMKKSGCRSITVSVESGCPRVLREIIRKPVKLEMFPPIVRKCRQLGIDISANFVIGLPGETWDEIRQTFRIAEEFEFDLCAFNIATPYPGTDLYHVAREQRLLPDNFDFRNPEFFGKCHGFITTKEFTPFELMVLRAFEWDRINFKTPEKIAKVAGMMNMTFEQMQSHRRQTRLNCGVYK